jgi:hypothetical protein
MNMIYVLILTMGISEAGLGTANVSGIATAEFDNKEACDNAAFLWRQNVSPMRDGYTKKFKYRHTSAICVPKGVPSQVK